MPLQELCSVGSPTPPAGGRGRDLGVTGKTLAAWSSVLEASGQVAVLRPYFANVGKRLVKHPKVYFLDTGILGYLLGLERPQETLQGVAAGAMFENAVYCQPHRAFSNRGEQPRLHFWRTATGEEVDFLVETGRRIIPVEAKSTATPVPALAAQVEQFLDRVSNRTGKRVRRASRVGTLRPSSPSSLQEAQGRSNPWGLRHRMRA